VDPTPRTVTQDFKFNTHKVQTGEFLGTIIIAYNRAYKDEGLGIVTQSQVLKANPGLNPNRLLIGQKIKIPLPGEIK
jgi:LysM repeat protein